MIRPGVVRPSPLTRGAAAGRQPSGLKLIDVASGSPLAQPRALLSSVSLGWSGILVEWHRLEPQELSEHYVEGHGLSVSTGTKPIDFGWKDGSRRCEGRLNPGEFHLLTHGELNTPRWLQTFDEVTLVLDRTFVADVVRDGLAVDRIEFATQRSARDDTVAFYAEAFRREIAAGGPNGPLFADAMTLGFTLHLLTHYAIAKPKLPQPRGKLNAWQLRVVIDYVHSHLDGNLSLLALAQRARVSPFHFARLFRATLGLSPHQFVLRQRVERALTLIKAGTLPLAQIAIHSGFCDQAHLTHAFRKIFGTTPAAAQSALR